LTGRRRQKSRSIRGSKREAQQALNALVVEADAGAFVGTSTTFEQRCRQWLDLTENSLSPTTLRTYRNLLDRRIFPAIGNKLAHNIRTVDLDRLYLGLTNVGRRWSILSKFTGLDWRRREPLRKQETRR
jgi:hypothetical protein